MVRNIGNDPGAVAGHGSYRVFACVEAVMMIPMDGTGSAGFVAVFDVRVSGVEKQGGRRQFHIEISRGPLESRG